MDPWKRDYRYDPPSGAHPGRIYSHGADGEPGGAGPAADIEVALPAR
jgi:hypothetical protein